MQDEDIEVLATLTAGDRRRARVAGGRAHDHGSLTPASQHRVEQPAQELQGEILKRQSGAVEQFEHPVAVIHLHQGRDRRMAKPGVARLDNGLKFSGRKGIAHKRGQDTPGQRGVAQPGHGLEVRGGKLRQGGGDIQTAVAGQPGQQHVFEAQFRGLAAGAHIAHKH